MSQPEIKPHSRPSDLTWKPKKSHNGADYQVGYLPPPSPIAGNIAVNWPVGTSGETPPEVLAATGIRSYSLQSGGVFFSYELDFYTNNKWDYTFQYDSKDSYSCHCFTTGGHWIDYNSNLPTIF